MRSIDETNKGEFALLWLLVRMKVWVNAYYSCDFKADGINQKWCIDFTYLPSVHTGGRGLALVVNAVVRLAKVQVRPIYPSKLHWKAPFSVHLRCLPPPFKVNPSAGVKSHSPSFSTAVIVAERVVSSLFLG